MGIKYKIVADSQSTECITFHPDTSIQLGINGQDKLTCHFGVQSETVTLKTSTELSIQEVRISNDILDVLRIPLSPSYEILYSNDELFIGPYIGILVTISQEELRASISRITSYLNDYEHIGGAILAFSLDGVQPDKFKIIGYLFNPFTKRWDEGIYSYPASLFSILEASLTGKWDYFQSIMQHFQSVMGNRIFNHPLFNKWEMYEWLWEIPELKRYLPETILYEEPDDIYRMLYKHQNVYIKPIWGRLGLKVIKASRKNKGILINYREHNQNYMLFFKSLAQLDVYFKRNLEPRNFIVQQSINLLYDDGRIIDFRLMLAKDQDGEWVNMGLFSRYGAENSIVSNITAGGHAEWGKTTLMDIFHLTDMEASRWIQQMVDLAIEVTKVVESNGIHCGNLGLDLAVDARGQIWILEINNQNPDHYIALLAGRRDIFFQARRSNILYAKRLAGFTNYYL